MRKCNRNGCDHILCKTYSNITGYICYECFKELEQYEPRSIKEVKMFMSTKRGEKLKSKKKFNFKKLFKG